MEWNGQINGMEWFSQRWNGSTYGMEFFNEMDLNSMVCNEWIPMVGQIASDKPSSRASSLIFF